MISGLNSISICKFWSVFCLESDNPFILDGTIVEEGWTYSTNIYKTFTRFCHNFEFALPMTYDASTIIWRISFIANTFNETEKLFLLEVSVWHKNVSFSGSHWEIKGRPIFFFNKLLDGEQVSMCL